MWVKESCGIVGHMVTRIGFSVEFFLDSELGSRTSLMDARGKERRSAPAAIGPWCSPRMMTNEAGGEAARGILGRGFTRSIERMCDREVDVCRLFVINFSSPDR